MAREFMTNWFGELVASEYKQTGNASGASHYRKLIIHQIDYDSRRHGGDLASRAFGTYYTRLTETINT